MGISDKVVSNLTIIYVAVLIVIKGYGFIYGRSYSVCFIVIVSNTFMFFILIVTLIWDVSRKAKYAFKRHHNHAYEKCKGGICWHGVTNKFPASQVRFRLPRHIPNANVL
ncbi:hypothetical protein Lalb_Chr23g0266111 [Lupinus albus]|uniref:Uncharacterized protein n=1 Tax=Lupinus albus TaxID=3870 RepID=A0A6A4NDG2_LUPAL|nr:hypothetical protein Lalb_Chr23g0266111 [Lupinus albus]